MSLNLRSINICDHLLAPWSSTQPIFRKLPPVQTTGVLQSSKKLPGIEKSKDRHSWILNPGVFLWGSSTLTIPSMMNLNNLDYFVFSWYCKAVINFFLKNSNLPTFRKSFLPSSTPEQSNYTKILLSYLNLQFINEQISINFRAFISS